MTITPRKKIYIAALVMSLVVAIGLTTHQANKVFSVRDTSTHISDSSLAASGYVPLAGIPGLTENAAPTKSFKDTLQFILRWGIAVAVILSVLMIILGGIQYMTTDAWSGKEDGKEKIKAALAGLILALSSYLILQTVNPRILREPESQLLK